MPGQPKPGQRRRRNTGQRQWVQLPEDGRQGDVPPLPGDDWLDSTRTWWATLWRSPMAIVWEGADIDVLVRLAWLRDWWRRGELPISALSAMQQLEDRYGLSPKSRRALQWEISRADSVSDDRPARLRSVRAVEDAG